VDIAGRRDSLIRLLRRRGSCSVADLAHQLGVSRRTVLRDLASLRTRGFTIRGEGGRGGGVLLDASSVLLSSRLAADEVVSLVLSVAIMRAAPWIPFAAGADRALAKIEGALPADRLRELRRLMRRILVGDPTGAATPAANAVEPGLLPAFEQAFTSSRVLCFDYIDREARRSRRRVEPHGLLVRAPLWYVIAWDLDKDAARLFRMDRVRRAQVQTDAVFGSRPIELVTQICPDARAAVGSVRVS
jgi:predicted DNA-binding transcriptional regulator YafY